MGQTLFNFNDLAIRQPLWKKGSVSMWVFHHVIDERARERQVISIPEVEVSADNLEQLISQFLKDGGEFISMERLITTTLSNDKPYVVMTFEDGYADHLEVALPILEKYQTPACVYVATGYPDRNAIDTWTTLSEFIFSNSKIEMYFDGHWHYESCRHLAEKRELLCRLYKLVESQVASEERDRFFAGLQGDRTPISLSQGISWTQLKKLAANPLITVGALSASHPSLPTLSDVDLMQELSESKNRLEHELKVPVDHFAYPYGHYGLREINACRRAGFRTAVTTNPGFIADMAKVDPFQIPRQYINASFEVIQPRERVLESITNQLVSEPELV